jgi:hypothetical protein
MSLLIAYEASIARGSANTRPACFGPAKATAESGSSDAACPPGR